MTDITRFFDSYGRQARLYPALITLFPVFCAALVIFPAIATSGVASAAATIIVSFGITFLLADLARSAGKRIEPELLRQWGGWPTTDWLRHRSGHLPAPTKARYHAFLAGKLPTLALPTAVQEAADPTLADDVYRSATQWLMEQTRGPEFSLVHKENANYGFRRNLLGLKPIGLTLSIVCVLVLTAIVANQTLSLHPMRLTGLDKIQLVHVGAWLVGVASICAWLCLGSHWVRGASDAYSRALLACCDKLPNA